MSDSTQEEAHTGPIKTPQQLLLAVFFSFFVPVFIIIALVAYVVSDSKPAGSADAEKYALGGMTADDMGRGVAERLRKVGTVEIRDANRPLASGETVFKAQCAACHAPGTAITAPKLGDVGSWANRIRTGFDALVASSLKGKGAMPPQAGGDFEDTEIARAVAYMANSAGGKFAEPQKAAATAAAPASAPAGAVHTTSAQSMPAPSAAPAATTVAAAAAPTAAAGAAGEALYKQSCAMCHIAGVANAPKLGDKAAWAPRLQQGVPAMVQTVIKGKGAMPPKGGAMNASDAEIKSAVEYMVGAAK